MDMETLFAFACTFPKEFAQMMDACADHVELSTCDDRNGATVVMVEWRNAGVNFWEYKFASSVY